jgi:hypothetical protein
MRMLIGGIFVGALAALVVVEILVCLRADSRRERMRAKEWEHDVDERIDLYENRLTAAAHESHREDRHRGQGDA